MANSNLDLPPAMFSGASSSSAAVSGSPDDAALRALQKNPKFAGSPLLRLALAIAAAKAKNPSPASGGFLP